MAAKLSGTQVTFPSISQLIRPGIILTMQWFRHRTVIFQAPSIHTWKKRMILSLVLSLDSTKQDLFFHSWPEHLSKFYRSILWFRREGCFVFGCYTHSSQLFEEHETSGSFRISQTHRWHRNFTTLSISHSDWRIRGWNPSVPVNMRIFILMCISFAVLL